MRDDLAVPDAVTSAVLRDSGSDAALAGSLGGNHGEVTAARRRYTNWLNFKPVRLPVLGLSQIEQSASSLQPPASSRQPPAASRQPPAASLQPPAASLQPPASSQEKSVTWRTLSAISGSPSGEESNAGKRFQDKALSWLLVAGSSF